MQDNFHRTYDPSAAAYLEPDPIGQLGLSLVNTPWIDPFLPPGAVVDVNAHRYSLNSPLAFTDPTGEYGVVGAIGGAAFNFGVQFGVGFYASGGDWERALRCINLADVAISAAVGAIAPTAVGNVLGGKAGPWALTRAQNTALWLLGALPGGYAAKRIAPDFRIGSECECKDLTTSKLVGELIHGI